MIKKGPDLHTIAPAMLDNKAEGRIHKAVRTKIAGRRL